GATAGLDTLGRLGAERVMALGLGDRSDIDRTRLNNALELGLRAAGTQLPARLAVAWSPDLAPEVHPSALAEATTEAAILARFTEATRKSAPGPKRPAVETITFVNWPRFDEDRLDRAAVVAESTLVARELVNTPALELYPATYAAEATKRARAAGLSAEV